MQRRFSSPIAYTFPLMLPAIVTVGLASAIARSPLVVGRAEAAEAYVLSADEQAYDCKKLTGRMQVRILEIRDYGSREKTTAASQGLQSVFTGIFGGPTHGTDPNAEHAGDLAMLKAYNAQLVAKGCKSFDLEQDLQPKPTKTTPVPTVPASGKAAGKAAGKTKNGNKPAKAP